MPDKQARRTLAIACLAFLGLGLSTAVFGPLLPQLATQSGTQLATVGAIFFAIFAGSLLSQIAAGPFSDRLGPQRVVLAGIFLLAVGTVGITLSKGLAALMAGAFFAGFGQGAIDVGSNLLVVAAYRGENVAQLNFLHLFFGLGAVAGPLLVSLALGTWQNGLPALWLAVVLLLAISPFVARVQVASLAHDTPQAARRANRIYYSPVLWAFALLIMFYVGLEMGMGGWTTTYLGQIAGMPVQTAAVVTSGFWLALTAGRLLVAMAGSGWQAAIVLGVDLTGAVLAAAFLVLGVDSPLVSILAIVAVGLSYGSIYPTVVSYVTGIFHEGPGKAAGALAASGSVGGMLLPWMQGVLLQYRGPASTPLWILAGNIIMLGLFTVGRFLAGQRAAQPAPEEPRA
jgi:fucose permease